MQTQTIRVPYDARTMLAFQVVDWSRPYGGEILANGLGCFLLPPELDTTTAEFIDDSSATRTRADLNNANGTARRPCSVQRLVEELDTFDDLYLRVLEACDAIKVADLAAAPLDTPSPDAFTFGYHRKIVNPAWRQRVRGDGLPPTRMTWAHFDGALTQEDLHRVLAGLPPVDTVLVKRDRTSDESEAWRQAAPGSLLAREVAVRAALETRVRAASTRSCVASWTL